MKNTKDSYYSLIVVSLIALFLTAGAFVCSSVHIGFDTASIVDGIIEIALAVTAFVYIINGFRKDYALNYTLYFAICALSYIVEYVFLAFDPRESVTYTELVLQFVCDLICFGCYVLLAFGKDMGKRVSVLLVSMVLVLYAAFAVYYIIESCTSGGAIDFEYIGLIFGGLLDLFLVLGKYYNKGTRNTK